MMRAYIGASESGKTYTMQCHAWQAIAVGWTVGVIDLVEEWPNPELVPAGMKYTRTHDTAEAMTTVCAGRPLTVLQPRKTDDESVAYAIDRMCLAARRARHGVVIAVPEAQVGLKEHRNLDENVSEIVHRFRHPKNNARLWIDTQMLADVSKRAFDPMRELYLFGGAQRRDGGRVRKLGGPMLIEAIAQCGKRASRGEPGWHVMVKPLDPEPPFLLRRE